MKYSGRADVKFFRNSTSFSYLRLAHTQELLVTMLDKRLIREDPDKVKRGLQAKGAAVDVDYILDLDRQFLANIKEGDDLKHERNQRSREIGQKKRAGENTDELHARMKEIAEPPASDSR